MKKAPYQKKLRTIKWLMLSSLTLLLIILSQWIVSQFKEEKRRLNEDFQAIFNGVSTQMAEQKIDSLIQGEVLQSISKQDSTVLNKVSKTISTTHNKEDDAVIIQKSKELVSPKIEPIEVEEKGNIPAQTLEFSIDIEGEDDTELSGTQLAKIIDSIKHTIAESRSIEKAEQQSSKKSKESKNDSPIVTITKLTTAKKSDLNQKSKATKVATKKSDSDTATGTVIHLTPTENSAAKTAKELLNILLLRNKFTGDYAPIKVDASILLKTFTDSIHHTFPMVTVQIKDKDSSRPFAYTTDLIGDKSYYVSHYRSYLIKSISPHVIFSVLLLTLTIISLWLSHRNLKQQYEFNTQKNNVISNISHELKTPVATTKAAIEALIDYDVIYDTDKAKKYLRMAGWEMNRLEIMISKVMNILQSEQQSLHLQKEPIDLGLLCQEVVDNFKPLLEQKNIQLTTENLNQKVMIHADRAHLLSVVYNLIENAIKYGKDKINIVLSSSDESAILIVQDNGDGIAPKYKDKIFDNFFRIQDGNTHNVKGHGLGLSYAKQIVTAHGGKLYLKTDELSGATFVLHLPKFD